MQNLIENPFALFGVCMFCIILTAVLLCCSAGVYPQLFRWLTLLPITVFIVAFCLLVKLCYGQV